jgi:ADP-ribosyl-[dinitrogen reductase] hydrolase
VIEARVVGALVGLALGDALGAPVEGMSAEAIAERGLPRPGAVTDDTEMALFVARSLVERGDLDMEDVSRRLVEWVGGGGIAGPSTSRGVEALRRGEPWSTAGSTDSPSSGCLPRCVPVALALPEARVAGATRDCCLPTHRHELALAASVALNSALARLVAGGRWDVAIDLPPADGDPGDAPVVLAQALAAVDRAGSAEEAIAATVAAGGDTDTAGAVAGALAGARWGVEALPRDWIEGCEAGAEAIDAGRALAALRLGRA